MKNRKKNTKLILLLLLICITLGYAALRTGLNINGTANVASSSWNVYFSNYQMSNATNITPTTEPEIVGTTTTSISYEVDLDVPGDLYEFSVEVVNGGSLDANISLVSKYNGTEIGPTNPVPAYITYTVTDGNGDPIVDNHRLNHGERETVKVFVKYRDDDASVLPAQDAPGLSFDIEIEATKAEREDPEEEGIYTVNHYDTSLDDDNIIHVGYQMPSTMVIYQTPSAARAAFNNNPYYLKHEVENDIVVESSVEFIITPEMVQANPGMRAGKYTLIGDSTNYSDNVTVLNTAFGENTNYCDEAYFWTSGYNCVAGTFSAFALEDGRVYAGHNFNESNDRGCYVYDSGASYCVG